MYSLSIDFICHCHYIIMFVFCIKDVSRMQLLLLLLSDIRLLKIDLSSARGACWRCPNSSNVSLSSRWCLSVIKAIYVNYRY